MDESRFDALTQRFAGGVTRRRALRALAGGVLGLIAAAPAGGVAAAACLREGKACKRGRQCCSGRCKQGPQGKTCRRVPSQGICTNRMRSCSDTAAGPECGAGPLVCTCNTTLTGGAFCGSSLGTDAGTTECRSDLECAQQFGNGAACVRGAGVGPCTIDFCQLPCPDPVRP